jgi:hypothetical protein
MDFNFSKVTTDRLEELLLGDPEAQTFTIKKQSVSRSAIVIELDEEMNPKL